MELRLSFVVTSVMRRQPSALSSTFAICLPLGTGNLVPHQAFPWVPGPFGRRRLHPTGRKAPAGQSADAERRANGPRERLGRPDRGAIRRLVRLIALPAATPQRLKSSLVTRDGEMPPLASRPALAPHHAARASPRRAIA